MEPDGTIEMSLRHTKDVPLELVEELKDLLVQGLNFDKQKLQRHIDKVTAKAGAESSS